MTDKNFIENFKMILDEPDSTSISFETKFKELDEWDSLTRLSLIAMVDQKYNVKISSDDIKKVNNLQELEDLIKIKK
ncbi:acyl carrier protein, partial [Flavobacteriaceae bacterium]|nr:acyl carrier protein [Flavobacteriaceae bacterium]